MKLLGLEISVYTRIALLVLEEKNIEYEFEEADVFADGGPSEQYMEFNPFGNIPCLINGDFSIYETSAITRYLDEVSKAPSLQPADSQQRARMQQIICILDAYAYRPMVWDVFVQRIVLPTEGGQSDEAIIAGALKGIATVLNQLELWLNAKAFFIGENISLADLHCFPILLYFAQTAEGENMLGSYPRIQQWLARMKCRRSVQATRSHYG